MEALLQNLDARASQAVVGRLKRLSERLEALRAKRVLTDPAAHLDNRRIELDRMRDRLLAAQEGVLAKGKQRYVGLAASLDAMSPLRVLARGYAIAEKADGRAVRSVRDLAAGDRLRLRLADGRAQVLVETTAEGENNG